MKLTLTREETPTSTKVTVEWDKDMFYMACLLVGIFMVGSGFIKFIEMML